MPAWYSPYISFGIIIIIIFIIIIIIIIELHSCSWFHKTLEYILFRVKTSNQS